MPQHVLRGHLPFILEASGQLLSFFCGGLTATPHLRPASLGGGKGSDQVTVFVTSQLYSPLADLI